MAVESFREDGQTYRHYQTNTFHISAKAPNKKERTGMRAQVFCCDETSAHTTGRTVMAERRKNTMQEAANGAVHDAAHRFQQGVLFFLHTVQSNSTNLN